MDTIYRECAGLDVHKDTVEVCVRVLDSTGRVQKQVRQFRTLTCDLLELRAWLTEQRVTHVAMEATGVFWKPLHNVLEGHFTILLVNAYHVKQVPGRKTDVRDCEWLAQLLQHGLLRGSFIPPRDVREWRDLTRQRSQLLSERARVLNRIHKTLEDANIKLGSVVSDIAGASGREILQAIMSGEVDVERLAQMARSRLRNKIPVLRLALQGYVTEHHRFMLKLLWDHWQQLEGLIATLDERLIHQMRPVEQHIERLSQITGVHQRVSQVVLAEIGCDMKVFPSSAHLASWAGLCPGNNESAGKRRSGATTHGSRWLKQGLAQAAWAASHTKDTYLSAQFRRLVRRRGKKRALVAVCHSILCIIYQMLRHGTDYCDLGGRYFDRLEPHRLKRHFVKRLEQLGYQVDLTPTDTAA